MKHTNHIFVLVQIDTTQNEEKKIAYLAVVEKRD